MEGETTVHSGALCGDSSTTASAPSAANWGERTSAPLALVKDLSVQSLEDLMHASYVLGMPMMPPRDRTRKSLAIGHEMAITMLALLRVNAA